jgi:SAM-dependent methyltransferase
MITKEELDKLNELGYERYTVGAIDYTESHTVDNKHRQEAYTASRLTGLTGPILDIGSYLDFIIGMSAFNDVTMMDVRPMESKIPTVKQVICDAKDMDIEDEAYSVVTSLCVLEHLGTCAFGDEMDLMADQKMVDEVFRVLRKGGDFIMSTTINENSPMFIKHTQRIYSRDILHRLMEKFTLVDEQYLIKRKGGGRSGWGTLEETAGPPGWHFYCSHWRKP